MSTKHRTAPPCLSLLGEPTGLGIPWILILAAIAVMAGCSRAPVVTLTNHSSLTLSNVVVSGSGFSNRLASVAAGGERRITVHPQGDTGLRVVFDAGGHHVDSGQQAYFDATPGYRVSASVNTDLNVSVSTHLPPNGRLEPRAKAGGPTLSNLAHSEEGGHRFVSFELRVPTGRRVFVIWSQLVIDHGTAKEMHGTPKWTKQSDPSGKLFGSGTRTKLWIMEPRERLLRLELQTMVFDVGPRAWFWKLKHCWRTKRLWALKQWPPPDPFVYAQSEMISSYGTKRAANQ